MRISDKTENETAANNSENLRNNIGYGVLDSLLTGISFYLGFIIYKSIASQLPIIGRTELLLLSFGMAFCYAFIFVYRRSYNSIKDSSYKKTIIEIAKNLTLAYLLDLGMLFLMKDSSFMAFRMALGIGLGMGLILLYAGRVASGAVRTKAEVREGKRRLILAGYSEEALGNTVLSARENANWAAMESPAGLTDELEHDSDDLLSAIDILQDGRSRVVVHQTVESRLEKREAVSANR
jgi:FlaA1/EpsC-like NDP-sugar epimerase